MADGLSVPKDHDRAVKPSLIGGAFAHWDHALTTVLYIAQRDHQQSLKRRTGSELLGMVTNDGRRRHKKLVTMVYNQFRDEMESPGEQT